MITAIYFHKILLDAEHAHREGIYQISLCEVVVLHMLEVIQHSLGVLKHLADAISSSTSSQYRCLDLVLDHVRTTTRTNCMPVRAGL